MWHALRSTPRAGAEFTSSATDLLQSTSRALIAVTGGLFLAWHLASVATWPGAVTVQMWTITLVVAPLLALALWLLPRQFLLAQIVWQLCLLAGITCAIYAFQQPLIGFLYALLPLMAAVSLGWPASLAAELVVIGLAAWLAGNPPGPALSPTIGVALAFAGALAALLGWTATHTLLTVTRWSLMAFAETRRNVEEARDQRLELKQTQQDLLLANRELARLTDRLKAMQQLAEEARRAKEEFVANVSHELRTPLNMIIGFSEMITQAPGVYGGKLSRALLADITAIQRNSQHLSRLVNDVLDLSQVEAGRMALSKEWASLAEIVADAITSVQALYDTKGLYLESELPGDLPPVYCDSTRIRQVLINLLSNAGRFTERGGVRVKAWGEGEQVVASVADTGPGIAAADQKRLFEPFQQLDGSIRRRHGGSGLGLSISKRFVEMHGGRMWLESSPNAGTTFFFSLPLPAAARPPVASAARWINPEFEYLVRTRRSRAPVPQLAPRFVVVEEGETLQRFFRRYADGVEVAAVRDVEEAIREVGRSPAQAVILNAPPRAEGPAPLDRLAGLPYGTPALSCWIPGEGEVARRLGVVRYLVKPVTREMLLAALAALGEGARTVLLVDDQTEVIQLLSRMLDSAGRGYRILQAPGGERALALMRERRPDAVLLDLVMPGMDGFQVLREKSQDPLIRDIPVIIVSSRDPSGEPALSDRLVVTRSGGLSVPDLLSCVQALAAILSPADRGEERTGEPGDMAGTLR